MASALMLVGGALVNALAFSGSNFLFSKLKSDDVEGERKRHDQAVEQLQAAQAKWSQKRTERLDFINERFRDQAHAEQDFQDVEAAMEEYARVFGNTPTPLDPEPQLSSFYTPSEGQKDREIAFVVLGMAALGTVVFVLEKRFS